MGNVHWGVVHQDRPGVLIFTDDEDGTQKEWPILTHLALSGQGPQPIPIFSILQHQEEKGNFNYSTYLCDCLRERGYALLSMTSAEGDLDWADSGKTTADRSVQAQDLANLFEYVENYFNTARQFFALPTEVKLQFEHPTEKMGKDNRGYVNGEQREYIKFRPTDPLECWPDSEVAGFKDSYDALFPLMRYIAWSVFLRLARTQVPMSLNAQKKQKEQGHENASAMRQLIAEHDIEAIHDIVDVMSSLSQNHYFDMTQRESETERTNQETQSDTNNNETKQIHKQDQEQEVIVATTTTTAVETKSIIEYHYPSQPHRDTGLLTLIVCSRVPGLQILDRKLGGWVDVELLGQAGRDLIIFMGEKVPLFGACEDFPATLHRVAIPRNTERTSMIFLLDVSK